MSEQFELFKPHSTEPTKEALHTGVEEMTDAEKFLALTGYKLSSYLSLSADEIKGILQMSPSDAKDFLFIHTKTEDEKGVKNWWDKM